MKQHKKDILHCILFALALGSMYGAYRYSLASVYEQSKIFFSDSLRDDLKVFADEMSAWPVSASPATDKVSPLVLESIYVNCRSFQRQRDRDWAAYYFPALQKQLKAISGMCAQLGSGERAGGLTNSDVQAFAQAYKGQLKLTLDQTAVQRAALISAQLQSLDR